MKTIISRRRWSRLFLGLLFGAREAMASPLFPLAQVPTNLRTGVEGGLGIMFLFGFIWGVVKIWSGADKMSKGDADGKMGIVSGIIIAGAAAIMAALFAIFGMSDGVLTPTFN
jgi:fumarate reductase subunit D